MGKKNQCLNTQLPRFPCSGKTGIYISGKQRWGPVTSGLHHTQEVWAGLDEYVGNKKENRNHPSFTQPSQSKRIVHELGI